MGTIFQASVFYPALREGKEGRAASYTRTKPLFLQQWEEQKPVTKKRELKAHESLVHKTVIIVIKKQDLERVINFVWSGALTPRNLQAAYFINPTTHD